MSGFGDLTVFAREWDERAQLVATAKARGETDIVVPAFTMDMAKLLDPLRYVEEPDAPSGSCEANYYGVNSLSKE